MGTLPMRNSSARHGQVAHAATCFPNGRNNPAFRTVSLFVLALLFTAALRADVIADARARYAEGEYQQAAKLFEQAIETAPPRAAVFFEFGRCLRQAGQDGRAALSFQRALVLDPRFTPAAVALAETNTDLGIPKPAITWRDRVLEHVPMDTLTLAGTGLFWAGAFTVTLLFLLHATRRRGWYAMGILCVAAGVGALALAWLCDPRVAGRNTAMVLTSGGASVLNAPAEQSEKIAALREGTKVIILSQRGRWFYGEVPGGSRGWFLTEGIVPIIPPV